MGTIIDATAAAEDGPFQGALGLADAAARLCLRRAKPSAEEADLLINAGVHNDRGISEPAIASLIQEDIGADPGQQPGAGQVPQRASTSSTRPRLFPQTQRETGGP
jgi:3-oxoacyl-[acyl-carrier-protein] synthase III